jgi:hypothetical protein
MPKAKTPVKRSPKAAAKVPPKGAKEVKETPKERLARLAEEKKAAARARR